MSGSLNKVMLIGHLGRDPESRQTLSGSKVVTINLATSESWKDRASGERRERTEWHRVVIFNEPLCEVASKYLRKGSKVYVEGQLQTRKWTDKDQVERYSTEIVLQAFGSTLALLDRREADPGRSDYSAHERTGTAGSAWSGDRPGGGTGAAGGGGSPDLDDDVPF